jgi:bifunctional UDP-N-acetylglucosamine pyrophosphorylase/glucosamine-1-phosphate N-acetyltransferase
MPKVFVPILPGVTIWDAIRTKLATVADRIVLVLSPEGENYLKLNRDRLGPDSFAKTEVALQREPLGMGDAIFGSADFWREAEDVLVVWGDQFNLSAQTLQDCRVLHAGQKKPALTLPVVRALRPYVEYVFDPEGRLTEVRQAREGDACAPGGFSDIGVFLLSGGAPLLEQWQAYRASDPRGSATGEINFLPFLVYLSATAGWPVARVDVSDPAEAVGINTPEELAFARELLQKKSVL